MQVTNYTQRDTLQKQLLVENKAFLHAVKNKLPLPEILKQYEKVKEVMLALGITPKQRDLAA